MSISISGAVWFVIYVLIGGAIFGLLNLLIDRAPFMPAEWKPIAKYILIVIAVLVLIFWLLSMLGVGGGVAFRP